MDRTCECSLSSPAKKWKKQNEKSACKSIKGHRRNDRGNYKSAAKLEPARPARQPAIQPTIRANLWVRTGKQFKRANRVEIAPVRIVFNNKGERRQAGRWHSAQNNSFDFSFLWKLFKFFIFIYVRFFFFSFRPAAGIFLLFFMLLICVACWPVDCPDELDSWTNTVGERGTHGRPGWLAGCSLPFAFVCLLMLNLTIGQNIIFAAPSHIWRWITRGRALNAHWWTFFDLQMSAGANVMNPWWHCKERKQINTKQNQKTKKPKQKQKEKHIRNGH